MKKIYLPAYGIITAVLTLLLVLAAVTYRNIQAEKQRLEDTLQREGLALIRSFEAGTRTGMMGVNWQRSQVQRLIEEMAKESDVAYIIILGDKGEILAHNQPEKVGTFIQEPLKLGKEDAPITRVHELPDVGKIYEIIKRFNPLQFSDMTIHMSQMEKMMERMMGAGRVGRQEEEVQEGREIALERWVQWCGGISKHQNQLILLGLKMGTFEEVQSQNIRQALLMAGVLLLVGSAALYFIFVAQNYHLVNRTLSQMRTYTQNVVASMANGLISLDSQGKVVTINPQATRILGLEEKTVQGRDIREVLSVEGLNLDKLLSSGRAVLEKEVTYQTHQGIKVPLSLSLTPLRDEEDQPIGAVILLRDLREIKELQKQVERSERLAALGRLATGVAHEIRNPLSSIKGFIQYFQRKFHFQGEDQTYASVMIHEVDRLNRVISDLLDFARPKEPHLAPHSMIEILQHALKLVESDLKSRNIKTNFSSMTDLPRVQVDRDQMTQVFLNLFLNALEAMGPGGELTVAVGFDKDQGQVEVRVSDTGTGISAENLPRIFDPFFTTKKKGTGLGLALVYRILEAHRGEIRVESQEGQGTTFTVQIPINGFIHG